jgi:hypothetical protein
MNQNESVVQSGEKPRAQIRLPQGSYIQTDQWMHYLGYEQYCWWLKFHSWVNRRSNRVYEQHVPYTLESVYEEWLGVSKATFYRKIKVLWECGLIDLVEFAPSERKAQKPRNIIVYEYPFNNAEFEYKPLEKRRDWNKDYESESKIHGFKGALITKKDKGLNPETVVESDGLSSETVIESKGLNSETVVETVDNSPEIVDKYRLNPETVTVSNLRPNNVYNNLLTKNNNYKDLNNSLSNAKIDVIREILIKCEFTEGERERVVELLINKNLYSSVTKHDLLAQANYMRFKTDIRDRAIFFVNGIEKNIGREYPKPQEKEDKPEYQRKVPFYNWLEEDK